MMCANMSTSHGSMKVNIVHLQKGGHMCDKLKMNLSPFEVRERKKCGP